MTLDDEDPIVKSLKESKKRAEKLGDLIGERIKREHPEIAEGLRGEILKDLHHLHLKSFL